jgi:Domain of unknown function (DUF6894)
MINGGPGSNQDATSHRQHYEDARRRTRTLVQRSFVDRPTMLSLSTHRGPHRPFPFPNNCNETESSNILTFMPRFFFHIADGDRIPDNEGADLPDVSAALKVALAGAREIVAEDLKHGGNLSLTDRIEIQDESGDIVAIVTFGEAVGLEGQKD